MPVPLHALRFENPGAPALIVLHGLLGSSRNWMTVGRSMAARFDVHAVDLRNHGDSPGAESMRWSELIGDLAEYFDRVGIGTAALLGHSLGGKIAMRFACERPDRVAKLVVADIAAKDYPPYHDAEFRAMRRIPVGELADRKEAEELLAPDVPDWGMRRFLLTNLERDPAGGYRWRVNIGVLHDSLPHVRRNPLPEDARYEGPVLLVVGERSEFVGPDDADAMRRWLPRLRTALIGEAGHNVHVDNRKGFLEALNGFL